MSYPPPGGTPDPYGSGSNPDPYGQRPTSGQPDPYGQRPTSGQPDPYGQPPASGQPDPYGQPPASGQPAPYGQPSYGQPDPYGQQQPQGQYQQGYPQYQQAATGTNTMAILALVFAFVFSPLGIVFGHLAKKQIRQSGEGGAGLATAGMVLGYIFTGLYVLGCCGVIAAGMVNSGNTT